MSNPFLGEIRMFAGSFQPRGWHFCDGSLLAISQNSALFALLGTTYGGDGQSTFGVPDMRGRIPLHQGQGPSLSNYVLGQKAGTELVALTAQQMPLHSHTPAASTSATGAGASPSNNVWSANTNSAAPQFAASSATPVVAMAATSVGMAGGSVPHDNMPPFLAVSYIIALEGIFPSQN